QRSHSAAGEAGGHQSRGDLRPRGTGISVCRKRTDAGGPEATRGGGGALRKGRGFARTTAAFSPGRAPSAGIRSNPPGARAGAEKEEVNELQRLGERL